MSHYYFYVCIYGILCSTFSLPWIKGTTTTQTTEVSTESPFADCTFTQSKDGAFICYKLMSQRSNHTSAQKLCNSLHKRGQMVAVTSEEVHQMVIDLMATEKLSFVWLGAHEIHFPWKWLNGDGTVTMQGCYADVPTNPDLEIKTTFQNNSHSLCIEYCRSRSKAYAGVQNGDACWCGNSFGRYLQNLECNKACPGNANEVCGGPQSNMILVVDGTHSNWFKGQPNNHTGAQSCGIQDGRNYDFAWNDETCVLNNYAMCQLADKEEECAARNATWIGNTCYVISPKTMTFFLSRDWCRSQQGELATYTNATQEREVWKFLNATYHTETMWLSLSRSLWMWDTDEEMLFSSWASGEPNGGATQPCVKMDEAGAWRTSFCGGLGSVICQIDNKTEVTVASSTPTTPPTTAPATDAPIDEGTTIAMIVGTGGLTIILILLTVKFSCCSADKNKDGAFVGIEEELMQSVNPNNYFFGVDNPAAVRREDETVQNGISVSADTEGEKPPKVNGNNNMNNSLTDANDTCSDIYCNSSQDLVKNMSAISVTADVHSENADENYFTLSTENGSSHSEGSADAIDLQDLTSDVPYEPLRHPDLQMIGQPSDASNSDQGYDSLTKSDPAYASTDQSINSFENPNPSDRLPLIDESHSSIEFTPSGDEQVCDDSTLGREKQRQLSKSTEELMDTIPRHKDVSYHELADSIQALNDLDKHLNSAM